jgi:hypothetical protein
VILVEHPIYRPPIWDYPLDMPTQSDGYGKFVRLNLSGEIVEVVDFDLTEITINFRGKNLTLKHYDVSCLTPQEAEAAKLNSS